LRRRASIPAEVVWLELARSRPAHAFVDHLEIAGPRAVVVASGQLDVVRRCVRLALRDPEGILVELAEYRQNGLAGADTGGITQDAREGQRYEAPISADIDRLYVSVPPLLCRLLYHLAREIRPRVCLELGTAHGVSALHLLAGLPPDGHLTTVEADPVRRRLALEAMNALVPDGRVTSIEGRFPECLPEVLDALPGKVGLAFEDGPHAPDVTLGAFELVSEHAAPGCLYLVDDIYDGENGGAWFAIRSHARVSAWAEVNGRLGVCLLS
jgi:predicted O-methyltransferase YrrM